MKKMFLLAASLVMGISLSIAENPFAGIELWGVKITQSATVYANDSLSPSAISLLMNAITDEFVKRGARIPYPKNSTGARCDIEVCITGQSDISTTASLMIRKVSPVKVFASGPLPREKARKGSFADTRSNMRELAENLVRELLLKLGKT